MKWYEYAKRLMADKKIKQDDLIPVFNVTTRGAVGHYLSGRRQPSGEQLKSLADKLGLSIDDLLAGGIIKSQQIGESNGHYTSELGIFSRIPVVGTAQLGDNGHWYELDYPVGYGDGAISYPTKDKNAYAIRCVGDSMRPRIKNGEFVIVEPNAEPQPGDEVLVKAKDGRVMVKTLLYKREGRIYLQSINESHPSISIQEQDIEKMHYIAAFAKKPWLIK